jgi:hypothetical protein
LQFIKDRRRRVVRPAITALVAAGALACADDAHAGEYTQYTCRLPSGDPAATDGWRADGAAMGFVMEEDCAGAGGMHTDVEHLAYPEPVTAGWSWSVAAPIRLVGGTVYRAHRLAAVGTNGSGGVHRISAGAAVLFEEFNDNGYDREAGSASNPLSPTNKFPLPTIDADSLRLTAGCGGNGNPCQDRPGDYVANVSLFAATFRLRESQAPNVSALSGSLTQPGAKTGVQTLRFNATDGGAGVYRVTTEVDGTEVSTRVVDANGGRCADAVPATPDPYEFEYRQPCKASVSGTEVTLNTAAFADGAHTVRVLVEDAAGNEASAFGPATMTFANQPAGSPQPQPTLPAPAPTPPAVAAAPRANGANASASARISARFTTVGRASRTIRYGQHPAITGTLRAPSGAPVTGATLQVLVRSNVGGSPWRPGGTVTTDASGAFRYVAPTGASRVIRFAYRAHLEDADYAHTADTTLNVIPSIRLRVDHASLHNGQAVRFRGSVPSAPSAGRKLVEMQVVVGGRWRTFATTQMRHGRFTHAYRFRRTYARTTYRFRARIRADRGWPFATGLSRVKRVVVRP